jgi:hypothetical protein
LPAAPAPDTAAARSELVLIRRHHHHGHWRHHHSRGADTDEPEAAAPGGGPPAAPLAPEASQIAPNRTSRGSGSSRPAIRWVNPEKSAR